jgi:hypothetical protein
MQELLDLMATTGIGLAILGASYVLDLLVGCIKVLFTANMKWSWKKMLEDMIKAILIALSVEIWVALWYIAGWYAGNVGLDITEFSKAMSIAGMIGAIGVGAFWYLSNAGTNLLEFINTKHIQVKVDESKANYDAIVNKLSGIFAPQEEKARPSVTPEELGASCYYAVDVSTPSAFYDAVNGVGFNEGFGMQCLCRGHYVLMEDGSYKDVADVEVGDKLYGGNTVVSNMEKDSPIMKVWTTLGSFYCTPEHKFIMCNGDEVKAMDLHKIIGKNRNSSRGSVKNRFSIAFANEEPRKKWDLSDDELRFLGMYLGDGSKVLSHKNGSSYTIRVTVGTAVKEQYLDSLGLDLKKHQHSNGRAWEYYLVKNNNPLLYDVITSFEGKALPRHFTKEQYAFIIEGYLMADGTVKNSGYMATSICKPLLLSLQFGCFLNGWRAKVSGPVERDSTNLCDHPKPYYRLSVNKNAEPVSWVYKAEYVDDGSVFVLNTDGDHLYYADNQKHHNCVAGFKEFQFSLAGRYVSAGGAAKNYASEQSLVESLGFTWHAGNTGFQDGDWAIWTDGAFGHVAMYYRGKWFGQNQGAKDGSIGNAFNLMSLPTNNIAGYYRPNIYAHSPEPAPEPKPEPAKPTKFKVGDIVVPTAWVDYNGTPLVQYDPNYVITQISGDRAVLSANRDGDRIVWAALSTKNISKV